MKNSEEYMFIKEHIKYTSLKYNKTSVQHLRILWTAFVLHASVYVDGPEYPRYLADLFECIGDDIPTDYFRNFDSFCVFMGEYLGVHPRKEGQISVEELSNGRYVVRSSFGKKIANVGSLDRAKEIAKDAQKAIEECKRGKNEYIVTAKVETTVQQRIKADSLDNAFRKVSKGCADFLDWGDDGEFVARPEIVGVEAAGRKASRKKKGKADL